MCIVYSTLYRWTCGHTNEPRSVLVQGLTSETRLPQLCGQLRALLTALVGHLPQAHWLKDISGYVEGETVKISEGFIWLRCFEHWRMDFADILGDIIYSDHESSWNRVNCSLMFIVRKTSYKHYWRIGQPFLTAVPRNSGILRKKVPCFWRLHSEALVHVSNMRTTRW